jgi:flavin-dependent dehydrogenase
LKNSKTGWCLDFRWRGGKKREMYRVVPVALERFCLRKDNAFLIGEAAGFISASSLEGISYALDSAEILAGVLHAEPVNANAAYRRETRGLRSS